MLKLLKRLFIKQSKGVILSFVPEISDKQYYSIMADRNNFLNN